MTEIVKPKQKTKTQSKRKLTCWTSDALLSIGFGFGISGTAQQHVLRVAGVFDFGPEVQIAAINAAVQVPNAAVPEVGLAFEPLPHRNTYISSTRDMDRIGRKPQACDRATS